MVIIEESFYFSNIELSRNLSQNESHIDEIKIVQKKKNIDEIKNDSNIDFRYKRITLL